MSIAGIQGVADSSPSFPDTMIINDGERDVPCDVSDLQNTVDFRAMENMTRNLVKEFLSIRKSRDESRGETFNPNRYSTDVTTLKTKQKEISQAAFKFLKLRLKVAEIETTLLIECTKLDQEISLSKASGTFDAAAEPSDIASDKAPNASEKIGYISNEALREAQDEASHKAYEVYKSVYPLLTKTIEGILAESQLKEILAELQ